MDCAINLGLRPVTDNLVYALIGTVVRLQHPAFDSAPGATMLADPAVKIMLPASVNNRGADFASLGIQLAEHNRFAHGAALTNFLGAFSGVHIPSLTVGEGFIRFDRSGHFVDAAVCMA